MHRLPIALALSLLAPLASAQVYKWTDAGGTVHYSQSPPAKGTEFKQVKTTGSAAPLAPPPPTNVERDTTGSAEPPPAPVADTPANRKTLCTSLKSNIAALQGSGPVILQQNGKPDVLGAEQRKQQLATAQSQYGQYCQSQ